MNNVILNQNKRLVAMNTTRTCGCKSFRTCYICETEFGLKPWDWGQQLRDEGRTFYEYNIETNQCMDQDHQPALDQFSGIVVIPDFITEEEESELVDNLDKLPWDVSQSGRRKQNFGPRANFKKRKAKVGAFQGFPACTKFIQDRFQTLSMLSGYRTVEQCSIEYSPEKGACIEPHIDDCWIWGERIVQLNLLSHSFLTCSPHTGARDKYNLSDVDQYPRIVSDDSNTTVIFNPFNNITQSSEPYSFNKCFQDSKVAVKVPLPPRSLLVMTGMARYEWEHSILREDIVDRRIVLAYRELTPPYLPGGVEETLGSEILSRAEQFW